MVKRSATGVRYGRHQRLVKLGARRRAFWSIVTDYGLRRAYLAHELDPEWSGIAWAADGEDIGIEDVEVAACHIPVGLAEECAAELAAHVKLNLTFEILNRHEPLVCCTGREAWEALELDGEVPPIALVTAGGDA